MLDVIHELDQIERPARGCAVALGLFDGVHLGHRAVIEAAVHQDSTLVKTVFTFAAGEEIGQVKGSAGRLCTDSVKFMLMERIGVERVVSPLFSQIRDMEAAEFVRKILIDTLNARVVCCGRDYRFGRAAAGSAQLIRELCEPLGIRVILVDDVYDGGERISSTGIREMIQRGDVRAASRQLGHPFCFDFEVVHGRQLGRTIDSPTINQPFEAGYLIPRFGVYASAAWVGGKSHPAVTNVGKKPTVGSDKILAETYILDYSGDLYGQHILVELIAFLRDEQKFSSIEQLKQNIQRDARSAREICREEKRQPAACGHGKFLIAEL